MEILMNNMKILYNFLIKDNKVILLINLDI